MSPNSTKRMYQLLSSFMAILSITMLALSYYKQPPDYRTEIEKILARDVLRVGTLNNQLSYYIGPNGPTGLDYELALQFANSLGVKLEMQSFYTISGIFSALMHGDIDIIASGLTLTEGRVEHFRSGPEYYFVNQQLVYKKGHWRPRNLTELNKDGARIAVVENSSHAIILQSIQRKYPSLVWDSVKGTDNNELLKQVADGQLDFTIADSVNIALIQRTHPEITVALELTEDEPVAWFMKKKQDDSVYMMMLEFFDQKDQDGELAMMLEKYFGHVNSFDFVDTRAFLRAIDRKLPKWQPLFQKYSAEFDWQLLAAIAYQESHWNPRAVSPTGVRGMMMLTLPTAKSVGVQNRLDPEQSIRGGADYLRKMLNRVPISVSEQERIWFALASYNMGFSHIMDVRRLTKSQKANPDSWTDVKQRLPLLTQPQYYKQTRYGYARGDEAKSYVENIRRYYQSIIGHEQRRALVIQGVEANSVNDLKGIIPETEGAVTTAHTISIKTISDE
ncbi:Transglycosylase [Candidatus Enterovibrio escicola]|uniref:Membrane-bound lytic murein transglycosylase F n=3 Tax=Candidatus Enterovibrio escicola TaxID=1927127 RepID=A0A2A5T187_9GAMM|nr:membrane-bound lytic murein transglycosylase MltF [Candidatus Enterovibrio escacola]PCS21911.1 Transglycosylase [Candidatus Enterovibrio escacola]